RPRAHGPRAARAGGGRAECRRAARPRHAVRALLVRPARSGRRRGAPSAQPRAAGRRMRRLNPLYLLAALLAIATIVFAFATTSAPTASGRTGSVYDDGP